MSSTTPAAPLAVPVEDDRDHILGPSDAPVTLVEQASVDSFPASNAPGWTRVSI